MKIKLKVLLQRLEEAGLVREVRGPVENIYIDQLALDSREVGPNGCFIAVRGTQSDGHLFIDKAVKNGAVAIVCEAIPVNVRTFTGIAFVRVSNSRQALAELASEFYGDPSRQLTMVGVTGTNGKTTTTHLIHHLLSSPGRKSGLIGTISVRLGDQQVDTTHTTPDALGLQRILRQMVDNGVTTCVMEVSSHALDQQRVNGIDFDVAIFTNLTRDHLDYHGSFSNYFSAKKKLFDGLSAEATALYNADDPAGVKMVTDTAARVYSYGRTKGASILVEIVEDKLDGLRLRIDGLERKYRLVGRFNAYNLAAAYGAARALGFSPEAAVDALTSAHPVPGRFEQIRFMDGTVVIVDYAHTPDALENVLVSICETKPESATLWCLFGCGGDRDSSKRRVMGSIAEHYAGRVVVTSDNPRTEDPESIMNDIRRGMSRPAEATWIVNRREAIQWVAEHARPGDVVLVAGKGHETYQLIGTEKFSFDDRIEVKKSFSSRGLIDVDTTDPQQVSSKTGSIRH